MKVFIGADHRGYQLKDQLKKELTQGYEVIDLGAAALAEGDDYVDYARDVAKKVAEDEDVRGIVICGSGVGVDIVANKIPGIRSGLGIAHDQVTAARKDDNINVLAIAADYTLPDEVKKMVTAFLTTPFSGEERYTRRLEKIIALENR